MAEREEFLYGGSKIPKLKPPPPRGQFASEEFSKNPLLHFHLRQKKHREVEEYLKTLAAKKKVSIFKQTQGEDETEYPEVNKKPDHYFRILRERAELIAPTKMLKSWEKHIVKLLPKHLCTKFPSLLNNEVQENKEEYEATLQKLCVSRILRPLEGEIRTTHQEKIFLTGRTRNYHTFLKRRKILKDNLFLTHPVMRSLLVTCVQQMPEKLLDFTKYRGMGVVELFDLLEIVRADLKKADNSLTVHWYPKIIEIIFNKKKVVEGVPANYLERFVKCASNMVAVQLTECMRRTITHVLDVMANEHETPFLDLQTFYDKIGIALKPKPEEIFATYHEILDSITLIGQEFPCLEYWSTLPQTNEFIVVKVTSSFMEDSHKQMDAILEDLYSPIRNYIQSLEEEYNLLYGEPVLEEMNIFLSQEHTFDDCLQKVYYFENYVGKIKNMLLNIDFGMGRLSQLGLIKNLRGFASGFIADLEKEMVSIHMTENASICEVFERLAQEAAVTPKTSEDLIEMSKYMLYASTTMLNELKSRINEQLLKLSHLLDMTFISTEHKDQNAVTVSWVARIEPIFRGNAVMIEECKFKFEEIILRTTESVHKRLDELEPKLELLDYMVEADHVEEYVSTMRVFLGKLAELKHDIKWINKEEILFQFSLSKYSNNDEFNTIVNPFAHLLFTIYLWQLKHKVWMDGPFKRLHYEEVVSNISDFCRDITQSENYYNKLIKQQISDEYPKRFKGRVEDPEYDNLAAPFKLCMKTLDQIEDFKKFLIYIKILCNPALTQRQWDEMSALVGFDITPDAGTTLQKMIDLDLFPYLNEFEGISIAATRELELKKELDDMIKEWESILFIQDQYRDTEYTDISNLPHIMMKLEEHILKSMILKSSIYVRPYESEMNEWYDKLNRMNESVNLWFDVQSKWIYFLPIFLCKDLVTQMPQENTLWQKVDGMYKIVLSAAQREPQVTVTGDITSVFETLDHCIPILEDLQKGVSDFFEKRRILFPRLFFLSNDELVELICESSDWEVIEPYINRLFSGMKTLTFDENGNIEGIQSAHGEIVPLIESISRTSAGSNVDIWLSSLQTLMAKTLKQLISDIVETPEKISIPELLKTAPGQVVLVVNCLLWSIKFHSFMDKRQKCQALEGEMQDQIDILSNMMKDGLPRRKAKNLHYLFIQSLHVRDILRQFLHGRVVSETDFHWIAQIRFYWEDEVIIRCLVFVIKYGYEYVGDVSRLVITALTERTYRSLLISYSQHLFGAVIGPSGSGKTETLKNIARQLAVNFVVFNVSMSLDASSMTKFLKGMAVSGAWVFFDNYNTIAPEVSSVLAQHTIAVIHALQSNLKTIMFEGFELPMNSNGFLCSTLDVKFGTYSPIPANLRAFVRTVATMLPEQSQIAQILLFSYDYKDAASLAQKLTTVYKLCDEMFSSQKHYDFGLCAVLKTLSLAQQQKIKYPDSDEAILIVYSMISENCSKLLPRDIYLFQDIIEKMFGEVVKEQISDDIMNAATEACKKLNIHSSDIFMKKLLQMYNEIKVCNGVILLGASLTGKSSFIKALAETVTILSDTSGKHVDVEVRIINPKSVTIEQLYGKTNEVTFRWEDGILSAMFREFRNLSSETKKWIVLDGPLDTLWMETMNSVVDGNKILCLKSGEVISVNPNINIIFEVGEVMQTSPSVVTRCGLIYIDHKEYGFKPLVLSWIDRQNPRWVADNEKLFADMFDWLVPPCMKFLDNEASHILMPLGEAQLVKTMSEIIEMLMDDALVLNANNNNYVRFWLQAAFVFGGSWTFASILDDEGRVLFDEFYKGVWKGLEADHPIPRSLEIVDISIPKEGILLDLVYTFRGKGAWNYWSEVVRTAEIKETISLQQTLIPTMDSVRMHYFMELHINHKVPMLLVGPAGTGKSFMYNNMLLYKLSKEDYAVDFITLSSKITTNQFQSVITSKMVKESKGQYNGPDKKRMIMLIDNMNIVEPEIFGTRSPLELLRFFLEYGFCYDYRDSSKITLNDILFVAAQQHAGPHKAEISSRVLHHFNVLSVNTFDENTLSRIFSNILLIALKQNGFTQEVWPTVQNIIAATLDVWQTTKSCLFATPKTPHYIFDMTDIAKVMYGCSMVRRPPTAERNTFYGKLWMHEALRVFYDKLSNSLDRTTIFTIICNAIPQYFPEPPETFLSHLPSFDGTVTEDLLNELAFGKYFNMVDEEVSPWYEEILSFEDVQETIERIIEKYNEEHEIKMDVVLFRSGLEQLIHLCRILITPCCNCLLIGAGGSSRQTLVRLASVIVGNLCFQPLLSKDYGHDDWASDLKHCLIQSGGLNKESTFMFCDYQIKYEDFLEDLDSLVSTGKVPNLFTRVEKQQILDMVRSAAQGGISCVEISLVEAFQFFISRCKQKLHVMLSFNPIYKEYRRRLHSYTNLVTCCECIWFEPWTDDALEKVAQKYLADALVSDRTKTVAVDVCKYFHQTAGPVQDSFYTAVGLQTYISASNFVLLTKSFTYTVNTKKEETEEVRDHYLQGLAKLHYADREVQKLLDNLMDLRAQLAATTKKLEQTKLNIINTQKQHAAQTKVVEKQTEITEKQREVTKGIQDNCDEILSEATPFLEGAIEKLNALKPSDMTNLKGMKQPSDGVRAVMTTVCLLRDVKPDRITDAASGKKSNDFWGPAKKLLGDFRFLFTLKTFDKDNIPPPIIKKVRAEMKKPEFNPQAIAKASKAAEAICQWVISMDVYERVSRVLQPKKVILAENEAILSDLSSVLANEEEKKRDLEAKLEELSRVREETADHKADLEAREAEADLKWQRADRLIRSLEGERIHWTEASNKLQTALDNLPGNVLVSCGVMAYLSPFTSIYREKCIEDWHAYIVKSGIPSSDVYDFVQAVGLDLKTRSWIIAGLPRDHFTLESAVIVDNSQRWSIMVDPQNQGNKWIKNVEKKNGLEVVKFTDANYVGVIENCIMFGRPVLLENIGESLEPTLDPVLLKRIYLKDGSLKIMLSKEVEYNTKFKFYITTKLQKPTYSFHDYNKITLVNFYLPIEGLQEQLLTIVVKSERPDMEDQRQNLLLQSATHVKKLEDIEQNIFETLAESTGNILEDDYAINVLNASKFPVFADSVSTALPQYAATRKLQISARDINVKEAAVQEANDEIEEFRQNYQSVARHSAILYYCITDLRIMNYMYQYSLDWFLNLYTASCTKNLGSMSIEERLQLLTDTFTISLYQQVSQSLFERDKLTFAFVLCCRILIANEDLPREEFMFFVTNIVDVESLEPNPAPEWLRNEAWSILCQIEVLPSFKGFKEHFKKQINDWMQYSSGADASLAMLPPPWSQRLSEFEALILIRVLHPDKLLHYIREFIRSKMGLKFVKPLSFDIENAYEDSDVMCPLIFISSARQNPINELFRFAHRKEYGSKFIQISLGQGQGPIAQNTIRAAQADGSWVCLQNCHLACDWMPTLQRIWETIDNNNSSPGFRLWITTEPSEGFPESVLQNGIKLTYDPPEGVKRNMYHIYMSELLKDPRIFESIGGRYKEFSRLLFALTFFHVSLQERSKFGPVSWTTPFQYDRSELASSIQILQAFLNTEKKVSYDAIQYAIGECVYGALITDEWDRRMLVTILHEFINEDLVVSQNYIFSEVNEVYSVPPDITLPECLKKIESLPQYTDPEVYGLHENEDLMHRIDLKSVFMDSLYILHGPAVPPKISDIEDVLIDTCTILLEQLPETEFDENAVRAKYPFSDKDSMHDALVLEIENYNILLKKIRMTLKTVIGTMKGQEIIITPEIDETISSILKNKIPKSWIKVSYPSTKTLGNYTVDFTKRFKYMMGLDFDNIKEWYNEGSPKVFWLPVLFSTHRFLTALLWNYSCKNDILFNELTFDFKFAPESEGNEDYSEGIYISGLFLEGAKWSSENNCLEDQDMNVLWYELPTIYLYPELSSEIDEEGKYKCPCYKTPARYSPQGVEKECSNFVMSLFIPIKNKPAKHWIKRGVAIVFQEEVK